MASEEIHIVYNTSQPSVEIWCTGQWVYMPWISVSPERPDIYEEQGVLFTFEKGQFNCKACAEKNMQSFCC